MSEKVRTMVVCPHCGAKDVRRLGFCNVCDKTVCERCGNVNYVGGERRVIHLECQRKDADSFSMIKFVD